MAPRGPAVLSSIGVGMVLLSIALMLILSGNTYLGAAIGLLEFLPIFLIFIGLLGSLRSFAKSPRWRRNAIFMFVGAIAGLPNWVIFVLLLALIAYPTRQVTSEDWIFGLIQIPACVGSVLLVSAGVWSWHLGRAVPLEAERSSMEWNAILGLLGSLAVLASMASVYRFGDYALVAGWGFLTILVFAVLLGILASLASLFERGPVLRANAVAMILAGLGTTLNLPFLQMIHGAPPVLWWLGQALGWSGPVLLITAGILTYRRGRAALRELSARAKDQPPNEKSNDLEGPS